MELLQVGRRYFEGGRSSSPSFHTAPVVGPPGLSLSETMKTKDFTVFPNSMLRNPSLSFKARGMLAMILSNHDDWRFDIHQIEDQTTDGREAIRSSLHELEAEGYAVRSQERDEKSKFSQTVWTFFDVPVSPEKRSDYSRRKGGRPGRESGHCAKIEDYALFLRSKFWKQLSLKCRSEAGFACQMCGARRAGCNAHHIRYPDDWYRTTLQDLICLCPRCHKRAHNQKLIVPHPSSSLE